MALSLHVIAVSQPETPLCKFRKLICSPLTVSCLAVRFGRIPKREKQRLLDEMQSYMNSLNESGIMDMDSSVQDGTTSTDDCNSKEAIGTISKAYRDIFMDSSSSHERSSNRANVTVNNNNNTHLFSQDSSFQVSSHPAPIQSNQACPVASNNNQAAFHKVDNYSYLMSTNQNHNQSNAAINQRVSTTNPNTFCSEVAENQTSCPWKLAPGAKVLVSTRSIQS